MNQDKKQQKWFQDEARDRPAVEAVWMGIPELSLSPGSTKEKPILIGKHYYNRMYKVKDGEIYTLRLGLHTEGPGAFTRNSCGVCMIPTISSRAHMIVAMFSQREIYPAIYADAIYLSADEAFRLELLYESAALECNSGRERLSLGDAAVSLEDDAIIISQDRLRDELPDYYTYTYNFITFQVKAVFEDECLLNEVIHSASDCRWSNSVMAKSGDWLDFRTFYMNNTDQPQEDITIKLEFPQGIKFDGGVIFVHNYGVKEDNSGSFKIEDPTNIKIRHCAPGGDIIASFRIRGKKGGEGKARRARRRTRAGWRPPRTTTQPCALCTPELLPRILMIAIVYTAILR